MLCCVGEVQKAVSPVQQCLCCVGEVQKAVSPVQQCLCCVGEVQKAVSPVQQCLCCVGEVQKAVSPVQQSLCYVGEVQKAVSPVQQSEVDAQKKQAVIEQHDSIVSQYKELIREQVTYFSIDSLVLHSLNELIFRYICQQARICNILTICPGHSMFQQ